MSTLDMRHTMRQDDAVRRPYALSARASGPLVLVSGSWLPWLQAALVAAIAAAELVSTLQNSVVTTGTVDAFDWVQAVGVVLPPVAFAAVGALIVTQQPGNRIGWLMMATGFGFAIGTFTTSYPVISPVTHRPLRPGASFIAWIESWVWMPYWATLLFLFLLFPTGRLPSARWKSVAWVGLAALAADGLLSAVQRGPILNVHLDNPLGIVSLPHVILVAVNLCAWGALAAAVVSLALRFRTARGEVRQQLKWFAFGSGVAIALNIAADIVGYNSIAGMCAVASVPGVPIAVGIAILRYRLFAIDVILSRTLVYGALTAFVIGTYILIVGYLGTLVPVARGAALSVLASGVVAVLFLPLHGRLRREVNRLIYGDRDEPYVVLAQFGQRMQSALTGDDLLPAIVETIGRALKLPYVSLLLGDGNAGMPNAEYRTGRPVESRTEDSGTSQIVSLPVLVHDTKVGDLRIALRAGERELSDADRRLLHELTRQVGIAVQAARLTNDLQTLTQDLQQSRERLVSAREEERRRLRRDLHDGLGPALASGSFKVEAARNLLRRDPERADALLAGVADGLQETIEDIRRLVYDLRPPALDQLGLVEGLRQYAGQLDGRTRIVVDASDDVATLPAAVEVAAYRIGLEAMANVLHHAEARHCEVRLGIEGAALVVEVSDDGRGLPADVRNGVGLRSMHERAGELGGVCDIAPRPEGGTVVRARLPLVSPLPVG